MFGGEDYILLLNNILNAADVNPMGVRLSITIFNGPQI